MIRVSPFRLLLLVLVAVLAMTAHASTGGVVPIGANGTITTDLFLRNVGSVTVTQFLGSHSTPQPNGSVIVTTATVDVAPGERPYLRRVDLNFDRGLWILQIDPRLEASVFLDWHNGVTKFSCASMATFLSQSGTFGELHSVVVDDASAFGTWIQTLNFGNSPLTVTILVQGPKKFGDQYPTATPEVFTAPPGISQYRVRAQIPDGGAILVYDGSPGIGSGPTQPLYVFAVVGSADGGTQTPQYLMPPGS